MTRIRSGSLKCVIAGTSTDQGRLYDSLETKVRDEDIRRFGGSVLFIHTTSNASEVRDWLKGLGDVLVLEFETWSGAGGEVPREWLLVRGH